MIRALTVLNPPMDIGTRKGDRLYAVAIQATGENGRTITHVVRDWRESRKSNQVAFDSGSSTEYDERRRWNVTQNRKHSRSGRTIGHVRGIHAGRAARCLLTGPSLPEDLRRHPITDEVVIGVNRAIGFDRLDYLVIADGVVTADMLIAWMIKRGITFNRKAEIQMPSLVAAEWCDPSLVDLFGNENIFWFRPAGFGPEKQRTGISMSLPELEFAYSVGTMVMHLADIMGCNPIEFMGADFSYRDAEHYPGESQIAVGSNDHVILYDKAGAVVHSSEAFIYAALKMEAWAYVMGTHGVECRNLTAGGLLARYFDI